MRKLIHRNRTANKCDSVCVCVMVKVISSLRRHFVGFQLVHETGRKQELSIPLFYIVFSAKGNMEL